MKTLTVGEAQRDLASLLKQAIAGEEIGISTGNRIVALHPISVSAEKMGQESLSPREALRRLQQDAQLTSAQADCYLNEVYAERVAIEKRSE